MLTLLLADAELELIPSSIVGHPQVLQSARRAGVPPRRMLLDSSLHYAAIRSLPEGQRRGRPDLIHVFLLTVLESIPNKLGLARVLVHTRNDELIRIHPDTRLIRNYGRFCGLIQQLFEKGKVGEPAPLLALETRRPLPSVLEELRPDRTILLDADGRPIPAAEIFSPDDTNRNVVAIIGGFPSGSFRSEVPPEAEPISLHPDLLTVWTVAAELLAHYPRGTAPSRTRK